MSLNSLFSTGLSNNCPVNGVTFPISIGTVLFLSNTLKVLGRTEEIANNMSASPSSSITLNPFESIMVGLIVLKLMVLRYLNILPVEINELAYSSKNVFGREQKYQRSLDPKITESKQRLAETMFKVLRRLDMKDCLLRTICELQVHSLHGYDLPRDTKLTLSALSKSGWEREKLKENTKLNPELLEERPILSVFEEAVQIGWDSKTINGTECEERYFTCPLTKYEILKHFEKIKLVKVL